MSGSVKAYLFNNCKKTIVGGFFQHESNGDPVNFFKLTDTLKPGGIAGPLSAKFTSSNDYWIAQVELDDGTKYISKGGSWKQCNISTKHDKDRCIVLMASEDYLTIALDSGPCQTSMKAGSKRSSEIPPATDADATEDGGKCRCVETAGLKKEDALTS